MASGRYGSEGNSGYDDDFESDGDGQGEVADGAAALGDQGDSGSFQGAHDEPPSASSSYQHPPMRADGENLITGTIDRFVPHGEASSLGLSSEPSTATGALSASASRAGGGHPDGDAPSPPPTSRLHADLQPTGSPISPPVPPLPPLNPTVSPYFIRATPTPQPTTVATHQPPARPPTAPHSTAGGGGAASRLPASHAHSQGVAHYAASPPRPAPHRSNAAGASPDAASAAPYLGAALLAQARGQQAAEQQQLATSIQRSFDVMRASEHVRQLQGAVEALTAQVLSAERGRSAAEAALVELTVRMQEQERRLEDSCEARLLEKQLELQALRTKVQQLEAQGVKGRLAAAGSSGLRGSPQAGASGGGSGGGASISADEASALRKELEQTELLIRGYQQENEAASRRIKELEESLTSAESRAAEGVLRTERATMLSRDDAGRRNADTAAKLSRVLALEKELAGVKEEAQVRESELRVQVDKLRAEKKALEARAGGVDLKAMADGDVLVKQLRQEMEASRAASQALIQEMQAKLSWYAENQQLLNRNDDLVAEQRGIIQQMQARLAQYEAPGTKGPAANRATVAQARVRELETQVDQLHKALRGRAPANSLAAVVAAARPSSEESALVVELRGEVEALEEQLRHKDEDFEMQLRTYQQQFEKLKAQYAERAGRLEAATKVRGRVKELERQLEEQKAIFTRRVRALEAKLGAAHDHGTAIPPTPAPLAPSGPPSATATPTKGAQGQGSQQGGGGAAGRRDDLVPASYLRARELEVKKLQAELERRSKQVSELHLKLGEAESRIVRLTADLRRSHAAAGGAAGQSPLPSRNQHHDGLDHDERPVGPSRGPHAYDAGSDPGSYSDRHGGGLPAGAPASSRQHSAELLERLEERCGSLTVENSSLRGQVAALGRQLVAARQELEEARAAAPPPGADPAALALLRRQLDGAQVALATVQRSATEAVERGALAGAEHQRAMLRLGDEVAYREGLKWQERTAKLEQDLRTAHQRCEQLEAEAAVARSRGVGAWSPEASEFTAMERRLDSMAREMATRESKWRAVLQDTQSLYGVQSDMERRNWESALAAKEAEVQASRAELQTLLTEVAAVQELQARAVAAQQQRQQAPRHQQQQQ